MGLEKFLSPKNCENGKKRAKNERFLAPGGPNFDPFFTIFCKSLLNMPQIIILKNQKNSFTRKISKSEKLRKWPKKGQKWPFFDPGGPNFDPFFTIFCKSLLNMPKNIILKNQKNSFTRKISKSEKLQKWPKKGQKWPFFDPPGPNFGPFFTIFCKSLLNMPM